ncbi:hypothetical protein [Staphylococcus phage vB_StaM_SA1]|nr:hypothetical protein [Staphylococcus phage vB_StaM_SA1]
MNKDTFKEYVIERLVKDGNELSNTDFESITIFVDSVVDEHNNSAINFKPLFFSADRDEFNKNFKKEDIDFIKEENFLPDQSSVVLSKIKNGENNIPLSLMLTECLDLYGLVLSNGSSYMYDFFIMNDV